MSTNVDVNLFANFIYFFSLTKSLKTIDFVLFSSCVCFWCLFLRWREIHRSKKTIDERFRLLLNKLSSSWDWTTLWRQSILTNSSSNKNSNEQIKQLLMYTRTFSWDAKMLKICSFLILFNFGLGSAQDCDAFGGCHCSTDKRSNLYLTWIAPDVGDYRYKDIFAENGEAYSMRVTIQK